MRPTEVSGTLLTFNLRRLRKARQVYLDAIRDWVAKGAASEHVFSEAQARAHVPEFTPQIAEAHAHFHLGQHLWEHGDRDEAVGFLQKAVELSPDSWNFFRQMENLKHLWGSAGPGFLRRARDQRKAGKAYYPLPDMAGMAEG